MQATACQLFLDTAAPAFSKTHPDIANITLDKVDFTQVIRSCSSSRLLADVIRLVGAFPEYTLLSNDAKQQWFSRWATAAVQTACEELLGKLVRLGHANTVASNLVRLQLASAAATNDQLGLAMKRLDSTTSDTVLLCTIPLLSSSQSDNFFITFRSWVGDEEFYETVGRLILVKRPDALSRITLQLMLDALSPDLTQRVAERIVGVWSDGIFVRGSDVPRHELVTGALRGCLFRLRNNHDGFSDVLVSRVLRGVQEHLECLIMEKRRLGMLVAQEFATWHKSHDGEGGGDDNTLDFELGNVSDWDRFGEQEKTSCVVTVEESSPTAQQQQQQQPNHPVTTPPQQHNALDNLPSDVSEWPSVWPYHANPFDDLSDTDDHDDTTSECSLEPLPMNSMMIRDATVLLPHPKFLRDCVTYIQHEDDYDKVEMGLMEFPRLIRQREKEAHRMAQDLVPVLLNLDDKFNMTRFEELRFECLANLVIAQPQLVAPILAGCLHSRDYMLGSKLEALDALVEGARRLGGYVRTSSTSSLQDDDMGGTSSSRPLPSSKLLIVNQQHEHHHHHSAYHHPASIVGKEIRRSKALGTSLQATPTPPSSKNEFAPLAMTYFFKPLVSKPIFRLEEMLLSRALATLGAFLDVARNSSDVDAMAKHLLKDVLPSTRKMPQAEIRRATLYAFASATMASPRILMEYDDLGRDASQWLSWAVQNDPDAPCRMLATSIAKGLNELGL